MGKKKTALVTGSSRGIGRAVALELARRGCSVAVNYIEREDCALETVRLIHELGSGAAAYRADVACKDQVEEMFRRAREDLGDIDILVSNAGIAGQVQIQDLSYEKWKRFFAVNVDGAFNCAKCAIGHMLHEHSGCIITVSSVWGLRGASCESAYSATKAALIGFTRSLANELAPSGIRVNCIAPGVIDTQMLDSLPEGAKEDAASRTPLCRLGTPQEIAAAAAFLASDEASFITGQVLTVDGGFIV